MKTNPAEGGEPKSRLVWVAAAVATVVVAVGLYLWLRIPPQMGASDEAFNTVDALYTAVRNHDEKQLAACEQRLKGYADVGTLPEPALRYLTGVMGKAKAGNWQSAAESLYGFMLAQRREGFESSHKHTPVTKGKKKG